MIHFPSQVAHSHFYCVLLQTMQTECHKGVKCPSLGFKCPTRGIKKQENTWLGEGVSLGTAGIDWWILFNIYQDDEVNQSKDKIKRSRKQKGASKIQREKKQDKKKRREAEQREAFQ